MTEILFWAVVVLSIVIFVGHGIWVALAAMFRPSHGPPLPKQPRLYCPICGDILRDARCATCEWPSVADPRDRAAHVLASLLRRVMRYETAQVLNAQAAARLRESLGSELERNAVSGRVPADGIVLETAEEPVDVVEIYEPEAGNLQQPGLETPALEPALPPRHVPPLDAASPWDVAGPLEPISPEQRAREFALRRAQAAAEPVPVPAPPPSKPRRAWGDLLAAFMEEKNIRWGELVGGLLIVGCSIALVISFWAKIAERPFLKFFVFNGVTAGLFGLGFYSEHRWKLRTTSHGLLITATLLVPLNFLAIAAFSQTVSLQDLLTIAGELVSIALFSVLIFFAGKIILPEGPWLLVCGVMLPSIAQLLVRRLVGAETPNSMLLAIGAAPLINYAATTGMLLLKVRRRAELGEEDANAVFKSLGIGAFAAVLPVGLVLAKSQRPTAIHELAPLIGLLGATPLVGGLLLWKRLTAAALTGYRTAGTSVGVLGALLMVAAVALAWPNPASMLPAALLAGVVLTAAAIWFELPEAHLPAALCLGFGYLLAVFVFTGELTWHDQPAERAIRVIVSGRAGVALIPLTLVQLAIAAGLLHWGRRRDGLLYAVSAGVIAAASLALVSWFGFGVAGDPLGARWVYLVYAIGAMAGAELTRRRVAVWAGNVLLLAAVAQGVVFTWAPQFGWPQPWLLTFLVHASGCVVSGLVQRIGGPQRRELFAQPLEKAGLASSLAGLALLVWAIRVEPWDAIAGFWLWLAMVWLALSIANAWPMLFASFQIALTLAVGFAMASQLALQPWFAEQQRPWLNPWSWQAIGIALAVLNLVWLALRSVERWLTAREPTLGKPIAAHALESFGRLVNPGWTTLDHLLTIVLLAVILGQGVYAALPGTAQELSPGVNSGNVRSPTPLAEFEILGIPHEHAQGWGAWLLMALIAAFLLAELLQGNAGWNALGLLLILATTCPLLASLFEADVAVASAWRWAAALFMVLGSLPIWFRKPLAAAAVRHGWRTTGSMRESDRGPRLAISAALALAFAPLAAMLAYMSISAVLRHPAEADMQSLLIVVEVVFLVAGLIGVGLHAWAVQPGNRRAGPMAAWAGSAGSLLLILGAAPLLAVSFYVVAMALRHTPVMGPEPESVFAQMGLSASYAVPLLVTALALMGYAVSERSSGFALAGGLLLNLGVSAAYLLSIARVGLQFDGPQWARLAQLNAIVSALYALAWIGCCLAWGRRRAARTEFGDLLPTQLALPAALNLLVLLPAWLLLVVDPSPDPFCVATADAWGWLATLVTGCAVGTYARLRHWAAGVGSLFALLLGLVTLIACSACHADTGNWLGYHVLLAGHVLLAWLLAGCGWWADARGTAALPAAEQESPIRNPAWTQEFLRFSILGLLLGVALAVRALPRDPGRPWWSLGALAPLAVLSAGLSCWMLLRWLLYGSAVLINLMVSAWYIETQPARGLQPASLLNLINWNLIALGLPGGLWLILELKFFRTAGAQWARSRLVPLHRVVSRLSLFVVSLYVANAVHSGTDASPYLEWCALAAAFMAAGACLWDVEARDSVAGLYALGLAACGLTLAQLELSGHQLIWTGTIALAAYGLLTSFLWSRRAGLLQLADSLRVPRGPDVPFAGLAWLVPANCLLAVVIVALGFAIQLRFEELAQRLPAAQAALVQGVSVGLLARGRRRSQLQHFALVLGVLGVVAFGWAWLDHQDIGIALNRAVVVAVALAAMALLYGLGVFKLLSEQNEWALAARRLAPVLLAAHALAMLFILVNEALDAATTAEARMAPLAILVVALTLLGMAAAALAAALLPGRDPLGLPERGRTAYVYGAEVLLSLLFMHIRCTMPWLFQGWFQQFWPIIVMVIAFVGAGLGEWFRRKNRLVLGEPLENTGALLPLLPVLGFWIVPSRVDYSLLLLAVGFLYSGLSVARRSFGFGVLAALSANGGLWYFLNHVQGYRLLDHPQLWLIPPALCVLAAAYINRGQLSEAQMTAVRYGTSIMIYVSSTADVFLVGVAEAPWLPLVLAGLSLVGILAGIWLRVRAFLFLGIAFLTLALLTIIWHAAVNLEQTWIWSVTGIVAGVLIIALFAVFEKKRQEVLNLLEQLKLWER